MKALSTCLTEYISKQFNATWDRFFWKLAMSWASCIHTTAGYTQKIHKPFRRAPTPILLNTCHVSCILWRSINCPKPPGENGPNTWTSWANGSTCPLFFPYWDVPAKWAKGYVPLHRNQVMLGDVDILYTLAIQHSNRTSYQCKVEISIAMLDSQKS